MELRQLKYFYMTAEKKSFSEAARVLYISQSTLSQQIKQLEDELGCPLFKRDSHKVILTECGERLVPLAKNTLYDADQCKSQLSEIKNMMTGVLNIGVTNTFCNIFSHTMKEFLVAYKGIKLNVFYGSTCTLIDLLRKHEIDFALAYKSGQYEDEVDSYELFRTELCVIARNDHPLCQNKSLTLKDIAQYPVALPAKTVQGRKTIDKVLKETGIKLRVRIELNEVNFLLELIEDSKLITILPYSTIERHKSLKAIPLDIPNKEFQGCVHILKDTYRKQSAQVFVQMLRESPIVRLLKGD